MRYCWLLILLATISNALVVTYPQANTNLPIGNTIRMTWTTTDTFSNQGYINIYLLSSPSPSDVVRLLGINIEDQLWGWPILVSQVQPNNYYLYLNDSNPLEVDKVAGPFYFTNSVTNPPAPSIASSTASSSGLSGPPKFPVWIIPIIVALILAKIACVLLCLWRLGYLASCCGRLFRKGHVEYQYRPSGDEVNLTDYYHEPTYQNHNYQLQPYQVDAYALQANYAPQPHQSYLVNYAPTPPPPQQWKSSGDYY
ncbi:hypothetical protein NQZ79_g7257 [Umbelopsis isabellina]|nr:hypothetical protein NQZ79_g7257 [Umbelopsis isabellina]